MRVYPYRTFSALVGFTVETIALEVSKVPLAPKQWIVLGVGRLNSALASSLRSQLAATVNIGEDSTGALENEHWSQSGKGLKQNTFITVATRWKTLRGRQLFKLNGVADTKRLYENQASRPARRASARQKTRAVF